MKRIKIPLSPGAEVQKPHSGGADSRIIFSVLAVEHDARHGGAVKFLVDPGDVEIHGDAILKDFCADGIRYIFNRFGWDEDQCVAVFSIGGK